MDIQTPDRIVELWPILPPAARRALVEIAERSATQDTPLDLTAEEEHLPARARDDFREGRFLDADAYHGEMAAFLKDLEDSKPGGSCYETGPAIAYGDRWAQGVAGSGPTEDWASGGARKAAFARCRDRWLSGGAP